MTIELLIVAIVFTEFMHSGGAIVVIIVGLVIGILIGIILRYKQVGIWKARPDQQYTYLNSYRPVVNAALTEEEQILYLMKNDDRFKNFVDLFSKAIEDQNNIIEDDEEEFEEESEELPIPIAEMSDDMLIKEIVKEVAPFGEIQEVEEENSDVNIDDIKEALKRLGYKPAAIKKSVDSVMSKNGSNKLSVEEIIIDAIRIMNN